MKILKKHPNLTVVTACFFWGTYWIPLRYIDSNIDGSVWPIFASFFLVSIFLAKPFFKIIKNNFMIKNYFFLFACIFSALAIALYSESLIRGEIAKVVVLFYLCPIWGTILAILFLKKKIKINRIIAILLGLIGLEIIVGFDKGFFFPSLIVEWIALIAGITWAIGLTFFNLAKPTTGFEKTTFTCFFVSLIYLLICFIPEGRTFSLSGNLLNSKLIYFWIILFSIVWLLPSIVLTYFSVDILDPGRINILLAFEVLIGIFTAALLTNESVGIREILGAIFVISACFADVLFDKKN